MFNDRKEKQDNMKVLYLAAYEAYHPDFDVVYQDINGKRDIGGDMMDVDLNPYDVIIATPPCNYWSIARGNRCSQYSLLTKHLLPDIMIKLAQTNKPYVIENVRNNKRFWAEGIMTIAIATQCYVYYIGRHTYFTNIFLTEEEVEKLKELQRQDFKYGGKVIMYEDMKNKKHQGGYNVHIVIDYFLNKLKQGE